MLKIFTGFLAIGLSLTLGFLSISHSLAKESKELKDTKNAIADKNDSSSSSSSSKNQIIAEAKKFFERYVALSNSFDPAIVDLYSDSAYIQSTRYYVGGKSRTLRLPASEYKKMILAVLPTAKAAKDTDSYSKTTYSLESKGVKITTLRHSNLKNYDSWFVLFVRKEGGVMKIYQELSQTRS
jgi:hypothetical protein